MRLEKAEKVLIQGSTGGFGMAAINLALGAGCEVFTTLGSNTKRQILMELFPTVEFDHIGSCGDTRFAAQSLQVTNGQGLGVILDSFSLDGDNFEAD